MLERVNIILVEYVNLYIGDFLNFDSNERKTRHAYKTLGKKKRPLDAITAHLRAFLYLCKGVYDYSYMRLYSVDAWEI